MDVQREDLKLNNPDRKHLCYHAFCWLVYIYMPRKKKTLYIELKKVLWDLVSETQLVLQGLGVSTDAEEA